MKWCTVASSALLSAGSLTEARRSWQHVGKKSPVLSQNPKISMDHHLYAQQIRQFQHHWRVLAAGYLRGLIHLTCTPLAYAVNGTGLPDVDFDIGESYAGLLSITEDINAAEKLFFWFLPSTNNAAEKETVIFLNGGPGYPSLEGLMQENGPFLWQYATHKPVPNPSSWNRLTNVVYIEQPVGTGFSTGHVIITNEEELAAQFLGFWMNFMNLFATQGYKVYITGESYAGAMLDAQDATYYNLSGMLIYDPCIGVDQVQTSIVIVPFADHYNSLMPFNDSFSAHIHEKHQSCGFAEYTAKYMRYPPPGPQPVFEAQLSVNPCFDIYQVATTCPLLYDPLGFPGSFEYQPTGTMPYFNRTDVKKTIHAPLDTDWTACTDRPVFVDDGGKMEPSGFNDADRSEPSSFRKVPQVIDATHNVIIGHGLLDMILIANGTLLAIQNMTWGGQLGFQFPPMDPFYVPYRTLSVADADIKAPDVLPDPNLDPTRLATLAAAGVMGTTHTERGLTFVTVDLAGHMVPQYAPSATFRHLEVLLGRGSSLSSVQAFTTEPDYPQVGAESLGHRTGPGMEGDISGLQGKGAESPPPPLPSSHSFSSSSDAEAAKNAALTVGWWVVIGGWSAIVLIVL
ncbi:serine-type carboxypeptidase [Apiospora marii]|uniref:serine-type carboxypeptidase n=1 Tax=Apiospora marii TaxID=335849 RepID=UPI00312DCA3F